MNLLTKLSEKFKNIKDETKKRILSAFLAGGIAISSLGAGGCTSCDFDINNLISSIKDSVVNNDGTENDGSNNGETQNPGDNNGGTQNPGDNNGGTQNPGNNGGSQTPDYSKYSQILQNVLTDQYYKDLIITDRAASKDYGNKNSYQSGKFKAIPFGFLEDEGYDIEKFKKNTLGSYSNLYTIGNDLYIEMRVESKASTNYYTHYLLKYNLTNQELKELNSLFVNVASNRHNDCKVTNYQAPFFIQELSYHKDPVVLSESHMTEKAYDGVSYYFDRYDYNSATNSITYLKREALTNIVSTHTFQTHMFLDHYKSPINTKCKLNTITLHTSGSCCSNIGSFSVFTVEEPTFFFMNEEKENYEKSATDITLYSCENANFEELNTTTFDNNLSL